MSHPHFGASNAPRRSVAAPSSPQPAVRSLDAKTSSRSGKSHQQDAAPNPRPTAWTVRRKAVAAAPAVPTRKYEMMWQGANGDIMDRRLAAPALPVFEDAFSAFARGTLMPTPTGLVAIEDLLPGDLIETSDGSVLPIEWIGSMRVDTQGTRTPEAKSETLFRITSDSFGYGAPSPDLMLGRGARYLHRSDMLKSYLGTSHALAPVSSLVDGHSVVEVTPMSSVRCFHICLAQHKLIKVHGIELETYHPGTAASGQLIGGLRGQFIELFPHLHELGDFGAMVHPRLSAGDLLTLDAA